MLAASFQPFQDTNNNSRREILNYAILATLAISPIGAANALDMDAFVNSQVRYVHDPQCCIPESEKRKFF